LIFMKKEPSALFDFLQGESFARALDFDQRQPGYAYVTRTMQLEQRGHRHESGESLLL